MKGAPRVRRLILLFLVVVAAGCEEEAVPSSPANDPPAAVATAPGAAETGHLPALGTVLPARTVGLGFTVGGLVQAVYVELGQEVRAGELLASLDTADLELDVREAEEALALSRARLDQARATPRAFGVAVAEAEYRRALAQHEALLAGPRREDMVAAQADHQAALARYQQIVSGATPEELIAAGAVVDKAEVAVQRAQAAYDLVAGRPDVGASLQAAALHEATVDYEAAKAQYERLKDLPTQADLEEARAQLAHAQARLELAQAGPTEGEVAASAAAIAVAQAQLALARVGPAPEDVAVAEAQVQQCLTALERAKQALLQSQLLAPFDGTISAVYLHQGEGAGPGVPVVELLDTSRWWVQTRNVGELSIARVRTGQQALVRVLAFRDWELSGQVFAISPVAVVQQGDTTYTVFVELESTELDLRPGMNAEVQIATD